MQRLMAYVLCCSVALALGPSHSYAQGKKSPRLVLKKEGYFVTIEKKDKILSETNVSKAKDKAIELGYVTAEEYFKEFPCDGQLVPGIPRVYNFTMNPTFKDIARSRKFTLKAGRYKFVLTCTDAGNRPTTFRAFTTARLFGSANLQSVQTSDIGIPEVLMLEVKKNLKGMFFETSGYCASGNVELTKLE